MSAPIPAVFGHHAIRTSLSRAIARDQLHHGLIFVGPRGVGKATLARGLACALHCKEQPSSGCGSCSVCRRILDGVHPGLEWIRPEAAGGTIKVAVARELATRLELAPFEGNAHLVVFDPAEALTEQAYNALLKTIEEPRPGVFFVMVTTALDALLPTILSRCLTVRFGRLDAEDVERVVREELQRRRAGEDADAAAAVTDERIALAVRLADGSAGVAVELALDPSLEPALTLLGRVIESSHRGPPAIFAGDKSPLWTAWSEAVGPVKTGRPARERALAARMSELWLLHLRERLRDQPGLPGVTAPDEGPRDLLRKLDRVQSFREGLDRNPNVRLSLEQTLLELSER